MIWKTFNSRVVSRPAMATISISVSQPAIHSAARGLEGLRSVNRQLRICVYIGACNAAGGKEARIGDTPPLCNA
jgi:hypothetical protein